MECLYDALAVIKSKIDERKQVNDKIDDITNVLSYKEYPNEDTLELIDYQTIIVRPSKATLIKQRESLRNRLTELDSWLSQVKIIYLKE